MKRTHTDGRDTILARIREASEAAGLLTPAPMPPHEGRDGLPEPFADRSTRVSAFARRMEELRVSFVFCDSIEDVAEGVARLARDSAWSGIAAQPSPTLAGITGGLSEKIVPAGADRARLGACEAGLVECLAMDAQTGAILLTGGPGFLELAATAATLVIIGAADRVSGSLDEAFAMAKSAGGGKLPPGLMLLTGASLTTGIERTPIARGHGPLRLVVYLTLSGN